MGSPLTRKSSEIIQRHLLECFFSSLFRMISMQAKLPVHTIYVPYNTHTTKLTILNRIIKRYWAFIVGLVDLYCLLITVTKPTMKNVPQCFIKACKIIACQYKYEPKVHGNVHYHGKSFYCLYPNLIVAISGKNHSVCYTYYYYTNSSHFPRSCNTVRRAHMDIY